MVSVEFTRSGKSFCLLMYGHANTAPKGEDLVCCAASALAYTAAQCALDMYAEGRLQQFPETLLKPGDAHVVALATEEGAPLVQQMFVTVATGLQLLARQYPEHMCYAEHIRE